MGTEDTTQPNARPRGVWGNDIAAATEKAKEKPKAKEDRSTTPYQAATKEEVEALWAKFGQSRVKALEGFRKMSLGQIAAALK